MWETENDTIQSLASDRDRLWLGFRDDVNPASGGRTT
jgi:hypothetical protein